MTSSISKQWGPYKNVDIFPPTDDIETVKSYLVGRLLQ